jgi:hypothetical protein
MEHTTGDKQGGSLPIPGVVAICLALLGIIVPHLPSLESSRPENLGNAGFLWHDIEDVDARLWQDPFAAVTGHEFDRLTAAVPGIGAGTADDPPGCGSRSSRHHDFETLVGCIRERIGAQGEKELLVLGILVSGGPYSEDAEVRMRTRYAVLSGLSVGRYFPEDAKHIGYFRSPRTDSAQLPEAIPFEWFLHDPEKRGEHDDRAGHVPAILLLWLDESAFAGAPLEKARQLEDSFGQYLGRPAPERGLTFRFIGPSGSDTLRAMANEVARSGTPESQDEMLRLTGEFVNAGATVDPAYLRDTDGEQSSIPLPIRTTLTDRKLAEAILGELRLRGIDPGCNFADDFFSCYQSQYKNHRIALISEWDTFYGRQGFPRAMEDALTISARNHCEKIELIQEKHRQRCEDVTLPSIQRFGYMRGLDGMIPSGKLPSKSANGNRPPEANGNKASVERPEGHSQKDYLRRLGERIEAFNRDAKRKGQGEIGAIGIVGSDTYDKLLILKALRAKFPGTLFFTTDLDTRLLHPEEIENTRNVIVASSFGLELGEEFQQGVPPFRDSSQTAYFLATQYLLCATRSSQERHHLCTEVTGLNQKEKDRSRIQQELDSRICQPRLFELGLGAPVALGNSVEPSGPCAPEDFHPRLGGFGHGASFWILAGTIVLSLGILGALMNAGVSRAWRRLQANSAERALRLRQILEIWKQSPVRALSRTVLPLVLLSLVVLAVWDVCLGDQGEPFAWAEGVSMWPTEIIRLLAFLCGCWFIAAAPRYLQAGKETIDRQFFGGRAPEDPEKPSWADVLVSPWAEPKPAQGGHAGRPNKVHAYGLWSWYSSGTSTARRDYWVIAATLVFFVFGLLLLEASDMPNIPFRGNAIYYLDRVIAYATALVYVGLVMLAFHVTQFSVHMITRLAQTPSIWPDATLAKFGLRPKDSEPDPVERLRKDLDEKDEYFLDELLDIRFISEHTKAVGKIVYYPFLLLALLVFARSRVFDDWDKPIGLVLILLLSGGIALISTWLLRRAAETARQQILEQLNVMLRALCLYREEAARILEKQTLQAIEEIRSNRQGAFMSITQEPAVQAVMLPLGGWGMQELLKYFIIVGL